MVNTGKCSHLALTAECSTLASEQDHEPWVHPLWKGQCNITTHKNKQILHRDVEFSSQLKCNLTTTNINSLLFWSKCWFYCSSAFAKVSFSSDTAVIVVYNTAFFFKSEMKPSTSDDLELPITVNRHSCCHRALCRIKWLPVSQSHMFWWTHGC